MPNKPSRTFVVIGGGAAGFFGAITAASEDADARVIILEKSDKLLSKVRISGGGRCNVTHACFEVPELICFYPRGGKELRGAFMRFSPAQTIEWFESRGVELKAEDDGRMFPVTDSSSTILNCLMDEADRCGVEIRKNTSVLKIEKRSDHRLRLLLSGSEEILADSVLIATGGSPKIESFAWLQSLGHSIVEPVPSLFTFNIPGDPIRNLMGLSVQDAIVSIRGTSFESRAPLLITHWGMSGPAVLKLSSLAARDLAECNYEFEVLVNWIAAKNYDACMDLLRDIKDHSSSKKVHSVSPEGIPKRLWEFLLRKAAVPEERNWADLSKAELKSITACLFQDSYKVKGKTTFKEEFVTCGGISLKEIDFRTMQSRLVPGVYFAGEVLDIDGLTGGFNFQAAWTTGFIAGCSMAG